MVKRVLHFLVMVGLLISSLSAAVRAQEQTPPPDTNVFLPFLQIARPSRTNTETVPTDTSVFLPVLQAGSLQRAAPPDPVPPQPTGSADRGSFALERSVAPVAQMDLGVLKPSVHGRAGARGVEGVDDLVSVIVQLEGESLAAYNGGLPGLPATNPRLKGQPRLDVQAPESQLYLGHLVELQSVFKQTISKSLPAARVIHEYRIVMNGMSLLAPVSALDQLAQLPGVQAVYLDELRHVTTDRSPYFIGADQLWKQLGGAENAGEGVVVGILDTGIWPEHPSFSDPDPAGKGYPPPPPRWKGEDCDFGNTDWNPKDAPFTCNHKLIGAATFLDTYREVAGLLPGEFDSARDADGHGTHVASTAAGNAGVEARLLGVSRGAVSGIAPRAHVAVYRVCGDEGCFVSDSVAAVEQAIADGVDVINFSITGGDDPYADPVEQAFLDAYEAGVFVAAAGGNTGPAPDTVNHRGPWVTTVAASTTDRQFQSTITAKADNGATLTLAGASVTDGVSAPTPVVFPPKGQELCLVPFPPGSFHGEIVVCQRGIIPRVAKSFNVQVGGAAGLFLYNPPEVQGTVADNHFIPTVHLEADAGQKLLEFLAVHERIMATFTPGLPTKAQGDVIASFSSRGGVDQTLGVNKPDLAAPGVQVLAGQTPLPATIAGGKPGELFQVLEGTSMASPHVAGAAALLKALHPDWSPGRIKSALMLTAKTEGVFKEDGVTPADPFDYGAGRIDLAAAADPGLTMDESADNFRALENALWHANYPSLFVPVMPGRITVERTVHNEEGKKAEWKLRVFAPKDVDVQVPKKLKVPPHGDATFKITVDARDVPLGEVRHAVIEFTRKKERLHFPITIVRRQPPVTLDVTCEPGVLPKKAKTTCSLLMQNTLFEPVTVDVSNEIPKHLKLEKESVTGATEVEKKEIRFRGTLPGTEPPDVKVIDGTGTTPAGGYLPLQIFGVPPIPNVGDETLINFKTPKFVFAGETWTDIGMVSNGYAVVGGGTAEDIQYINQHLPDPTPPNNVLAPFWTDLNPGAGGALYAAILSSGANRWFVLEWTGVPEYTDGIPAFFQIWIGLNGVEDVSYAYGFVGDGDQGLLTVGAENRFGNRGANWYVNGTGILPTFGSELRVVSTLGAPASYSISYMAEAKGKGAFQNCAEMDSDSFFGTNISCFEGKVLKELEKKDHDDEHDDD